MQVLYGVLPRDPSVLSWVVRLISGFVGQLHCAPTRDEPLASPGPFSRLHMAADEPNGGMISICSSHLRWAHGSTIPHASSALSRGLGTSGSPTCVWCHHANLGRERPSLWLCRCGRRQTMIGKLA